jgi:hypothetical protein
MCSIPPRTPVLVERHQTRDSSPSDKGEMSTLGRWICIHPESPCAGVHLWLVCRANRPWAGIVFLSLRLADQGRCTQLDSGDELGEVVIGEAGMIADLPRNRSQRLLVSRRW